MKIARIVLLTFFTLICLFSCKDNSLPLPEVSSGKRC